MSAQAVYLCVSEARLVLRVFCANEPGYMCVSGTQVPVGTCVNIYVNTIE